LPPRTAGRFVISAGHPALPGHFPGRPIVPGVVLLDEALALIRADLANASMPALTSAKFLGMVLPGQVVEVRYGPPGPRIALACVVDGAVVLHGQLG
jgi:3-hydroxyacyl-[acyl-carrier-protein] dehydratase